MPVAPDFLPDAALREWNRLERYLVALGRVAPIDRQSLVAYCMSWELFDRIMREELGDEHASLIVDGPRHEIAHQQLTPLCQAANKIYVFAGMFGLTARTRDLDLPNSHRKASAIKRLMGKHETHIAPSVVPMMPKWDDDAMRLPAWANSRVRDEYNRVKEQLEVLDLFTPLDLIPLTVACSIFDLFVRCQEQMGNLYTTVVNGNGVAIGRKANPLSASANELLEILTRYYRDYGVAPVNRKVFAGEEKPKEKTTVPLIFKGAFKSG